MKQAPCNASPCQNSGLCANTATGPNYYSCTCINGFTGSTCGTGIYVLKLVLP